MELSIRNISKTYPSGVQALKSINRMILLGLCVLLATNGELRDVLMHVLATLHEPDKGPFLFKDIDVVGQLSQLLHFVLDTLF